MNSVNSALQHGVQLYKSIDDAWIALLTLSLFICVSSLVCMIVLSIQWRRHQKQHKPSEISVATNRSMGKTKIPVHIEDEPLPTYETQKMEVFVSQNNDQERMYAHFAPVDNIQNVRGYYERTAKAYF